MGRDGRGSFLYKKITTLASMETMLLCSEQMHMCTWIKEREAEVAREWDEKRRRIEGMGVLDWRMVSCRRRLASRFGRSSVLASMYDGEKAWAGI
jgi:hypothetical protein